MTLFEIDAPREPLVRNVLSGIKTKFGNALRVVQYGRMMQAMSELSDAQLEAIGLSRADIPDRAHECIYGERD